MSDVGFRLRYWLARTQFGVTLASRNVIETGPFGSYARPVLDILIDPRTVTDPSGRQDLTVDGTLLERLSLTISLDDRGLIESISTEASRDASPVINLLGDPMDLEAGVAVTASMPAEDKAHQRPLEEEWGLSNGQLAEHAGEIEANIGRLLNELGRADSTATSILQNAQALELLQTQLAAISHVKRSWLAEQSCERERGEWQLSPADLLHVADAELPGRLRDADIGEPTSEMAERFGVVVAIADPERAGVGIDTPRTKDLQDALVLRRTRPATVGAYVRAQDGSWRLEAGSVLTMDIRDEFSELDRVPLDGTWLRGKSFNLAFHPDMSLKALGLTNAAKHASGATTRGNSRRRRAASDPRQPLVPGTEPLGSVAGQVDLPRTGSAYEVLAAARTEAARPTIHEQRRKIHDDV